MFVYLKMLKLLTIGNALSTDFVLRMSKCTLSRTNTKALTKLDIKCSCGFSKASEGLTNSPVITHNYQNNLLPKTIATIN